MSPARYRFDSFLKTRLRGTCKCSSIDLKFSKRRIFNISSLCESRQLQWEVSQKIHCVLNRAGTELSRQLPRFGWALLCGQLLNQSTHFPAEEATRSRYSGKWMHLLNCAPHKGRSQLPCSLGERTGSRHPAPGPENSHASQTPECTGAGLCGGDPAAPLPREGPPRRPSASHGQWRGRCTTALTIIFFFCLPEHVRCSIYFEIIYICPTPCTGPNMWPLRAQTFYPKKVFP